MADGKNGKNQGDAELRSWFEEGAPDTALTTCERVKRALRNFARDGGRGARLPSIRAMSAIFPASPASVQRAVSDLINEGLLIAKTGVGLFVSRRCRTDSAVPEELSSLEGDFTVRILHWEPDESRQALMSRLVRSFRETIGGRAHARLYFQARPDWRPDVRINLPPPENALNLRVMAAHEIAAGRFQVATDFLAPPAYLCGYLACNRKLLEKYRLPEPDFSDFDGQNDYVRRVAERCRVLRVPGPGTVNRPTGILKTKLLFLLRRMRAGERDCSGFAAELRRGMAFYGHFAFCRNCRELEMRTRFVNGELPLIGTYTCDLPDFPAGTRIVPLLGTDDCPTLEPLNAAADAGTRVPFEAVRFLQALQTPEAAAGFRELGFVALDRTGTYFNTPELRTALRIAENGVFRDAVESYLFMHIVDDFLLRAAAEPENLDALWNDCLAYCGNAISWLENRSIKKG